MIFLGFIVSAEGISADPDKVKALREWHEPKTISKVRSFHGLATFYRHFIWEFISIMVPTLIARKRGSLIGLWLPQAFQLIKKKMIEAPVLRQPDFSKVF